MKTQSFDHQVVDEHGKTRVDKQCLYQLFPAADGGLSGYVVAAVGKSADDLSQSKLFRTEAEAADAWTAHWCSTQNGLNAGLIG